MTALDAAVSTTVPMGVHVSASTDTITPGPPSPRSLQGRRAFLSLSEQALPPSLQVGLQALSSTGDAPTSPTATALRTPPGVKRPVRHIPPGALAPGPAPGVVRTLNFTALTTGENDADIPYLRSNASTGNSYGVYFLLFVALVAVVAGGYFFAHFYGGLLEKIELLR